MNNYREIGNYRKRGGFLSLSLKVSVFILLLSYCAFVFSAPDTPAAKPKAGSPQESTTQVEQQDKPSAPVVHPITQAAFRSGVLSCASIINRVVTFLTANSKSTGSYLFGSKNRPDQSIFSVSLELQKENAKSVYASASFAPLTDGRTSAVYDKIEYMDQSCEYVEKNVFKNLKRKGVLQKDIIMLDGGPVAIFLMPAGKGCIVIMKEVVE